MVCRVRTGRLCATTGIANSWMLISRIPRTAKPRGTSSAWNRAGSGTGARGDDIRSGAYLSLLNEAGAIAESWSLPRAFGSFICA